MREPIQQVIFKIGRFIPICFKLKEQVRPTCGNLVVLHIRFFFSLLFSSMAIECEAAQKWFEGMQ